ncbi:hypothetical protein ABZ705_29475 [Streptomyces sp. NPDC006984]|uniref:Rv1733c family protein n=1 Tax=Streptomyces sp. NPDC006984 TaxID=3155463 RepID=UPI003403F6AF
MSAQGSPHPPGTPPPDRGGAPTGANPLRRTSDRVESWCRLLLALVLLLGLPAAALGAGTAVYASSLRAAQEQAEQRQEVTARLTAGTSGPSAYGQQSAQIRWTDGDGTVRTGTTLVDAGTAEGTAVRVWVDRDGRLTGAPASEANAAAGGWSAGLAAALGVAGGVYAARAGVRRALDRGRYARWDREWDLVEPVWSARFRP